MRNWFSIVLNKRGDELRKLKSVLSEWYSSIGFTNASLCARFA